MIFTAVSAEPLRHYRLSSQRFDGWSSISSVITEQKLAQIWRRQLDNLPRGVDGYTMVAYQVIETDSPVQAESQVEALLDKEQFNDYIAKGFSVTTADWTTRGIAGAVFTVNGLNQSTKGAKAQRALIYTLAFTRDARLIWLQVRTSVITSELAPVDRAIKNSGSDAFAQALADDLITLWTVPPPVAMPEAPAQDSAPAPEVETVPSPSATPPAVAPTPQDEPANATPPPATSSTAAPPHETPDAAPISTPAPPAIDGQPWRTADGLTLILPKGWKVSGKMPYLITSVPGAVIRLYPPESYKTDADRDRLLQEFVAGQRSIAQQAFGNEPVQIDGATGMRAHYTNIDRRTVYAYLLAKSGRLWQVQVDVAGEQTPLPELIAACLANLKIP